MNLWLRSVASSLAFLGVGVVPVVAAVLLFDRAAGPAGASHPRRCHACSVNPPGQAAVRDAFLIRQGIIEAASATD